MPLNTGLTRGSAIYRPQPKPKPKKKKKKKKVLPGNIKPGGDAFMWDTPWGNSPQAGDDGYAGVGYEDEDEDTGKGDDEDDGGAAAQAAADKAAANADAVASLTMMLQAWGLESLVPVITGLIQQDYSTNQILLEIRKSEPYKKRFSGNEMRIKQGYAALEPSEYLALEDSYQRILQSAGLPKGFYDDPADFAGWIGQNVSAAEVSERVGFATDAVNNSDPNYLRALTMMGFSQGDLVANMLDQGRAMPLLRKAVGTSRLGSAALGAGLDFNTERNKRWYDILAGADGTIDMGYAKEAYGQVAGALPRAHSLSNLYGEQVTQDVLEEEFLGRNESAAQKRKRLAQFELSQYRGSGAAGEKSLGTKSRGEY